MVTIEKAEPLELEVIEFDAQAMHDDAAIHRDFRPSDPILMSSSSIHCTHPRAPESLILPSNPTG